jgi:hypothetical protein
MFDFWLICHGFSLFFRKSGCSCHDFSNLGGSVFTHTHALHELSCLFEFSMIRKIICANWNLNSHLYLCLFFEMFSDCVIRWLYMCVLTLTWGNLIYVNFSQFFRCFSVERPDGLHWRPNGLVVRTALSWSPNESRAQSSGQDLIESGRMRQPSGGRWVKPSGRGRPVHMFPMQRASGRR